VIDHRTARRFVPSILDAGLVKSKRHHVDPSKDDNLWLDPRVHDPKRLQHLLVPFAADEMEAYPVSRLVNDPENDLPDCIQPIKREGWIPGMSL
jgi:hypothetical protein